MERGTERRTERGTEVRCGPRARLDWTHPKSVKCLFQSIGQKLSILIYSLRSLAQLHSLLSCLSQVGRSQRSCA